MFKVNPLRKRQFIGIAIGVLIAISVVAFLSLYQDAKGYVSLGAMNTGHNDMDCATCHIDAKGSLSQQLQSNFQYLIGARKHPVDFGTKEVTSDNCLECHDRANDRHPIYRFEEPRFKDAIQQINAITCLTCHKEHKGERITLANLSYCFNCHKDMEVDEDPLDISHADLVKNEEWQTCMQCHDFHGNHRYELAEKMADTIPVQKLIDYMKGGEDPFGTDKKYFSLSEVEWMKKYGEKLKK